MVHLRPEWYSKRSQTIMKNMPYRIKNTAVKAEAIVTKKRAHTKLYAKNNTKNYSSQARDKIKQIVKKKSTKNAKQEKSLKIKTLH